MGQKKLQKADKNDDNKDDLEGTANNKDSGMTDNKDDSEGSADNKKPWVDD